MASVRILYTCKWAWSYLVIKWVLYTTELELVMLRSVSLIVCLLSHQVNCLFAESAFTWTLVKWLIACYLVLFRVV